MCWRAEDGGQDSDALGDAKRSDAHGSVGPGHGISEPDGTVVTLAVHCRTAAREHTGIGDVIGTWMLSIPSGHRRYANVTTIRGDGVKPGLLDMGKVVSESSPRKGPRHGQRQEILRGIVTPTAP